MKLHVFQKTKDGQYVKPYLVEGKVVYAYDKSGKLVVKRINDFFTKVKNEVPIISVEKNDDVIISKEEFESQDDNSFFVDEPATEPATEPAIEKDESTDNEDSYEDELMNIGISTDVVKEEPEQEEVKHSKVIITENDPYGDYF